MKSHAIFIPINPIHFSEADIDDLIEVCKLNPQAFIFVMRPSIDSHGTFNDSGPKTKAKIKNGTLLIRQFGLQHNIEVRVESESQITTICIAKPDKVINRNKVKEKNRYKKKRKTQAEIAEFKIMLYADSTYIALPNSELKHMYYNCSYNKWVLGTYEPDLPYTPRIRRVCANNNNQSRTEGGNTPAS